MGQETFETEHNSGFRKKRYPGPGPERVVSGFNATPIVDLLSTKESDIPTFLATESQELQAAQVTAFDQYIQTGGATAGPIALRGTMDL